MKLSKTEENLATAAAKAGMDEKTARKWLRMGRQPSEVKKARTYRTRPDAFAELPNPGSRTVRVPSYDAGHAISMDAPSELVGDVASWLGI